ncbi:HutD/Ves family protein [Variovorax sp. PAMC 28711]|uniref:HutD/Ves family protein n=1 Tax=Variovorax sp. PAMC 28711 TaxID=1795631 RepID=UPI00078E33FB|nr:HutD family protein [Variovorax sp. PAMC 28711]AMM24634.1 histidine utilization protein HutD [Variovorax sp. PAMC 28711]
MTVQRFSQESATATAWKNGGGSTREIGSWPPGSGLDDFDWRVSIATIEASGPFSVFTGVDRTIMLLAGDGVQLRGEGVKHLLDTLHEPFAFSGDVAIQCTLLGGESTDFNVMSRRGRCRAEVRIVEDRPALLQRSRRGLLMSIDGHWRVSGSQLTQGQGIWWADEAQEWDLEPASRGARLVVVDIHDADEIESSP